MASHKLVIFLGLLLFLEMLCSLTMATSDCPLDLSQSNFTLAASICSIKEDRGKCCRYINALIAVSVARYANITSNLGVSLDLVEICLRTISATLDLYGVTRNATVFCGFGTKIPVNYDCQGRTTVNQMLQSPKFTDVEDDCKAPLRLESDCRKCLNSGILYLRNLVGPVAGIATFSICRDATFVALASQVGNASSVDIASCFFGVEGLLSPRGSSPSLLSPQVSPSPPFAASPSQLSLSAPLKEKSHRYHLTLFPGKTKSWTLLIQLIRPIQKLFTILQGNVRKVLTVHSENSTSRRQRRRQTILAPKLGKEDLALCTKLSLMVVLWQQ